MVRELLATAGREDLEDAATLLVSELVTNALLHAGTTIDVVAGLEQEGLLVEVADGSLHLPVPRRYATTSGTGRGLRMLEQLVDDWGVRRHNDGKTVWFLLSDGDRGLEGEAALLGFDAEGFDLDAFEDDGFDDAEPVPTVQVELLNLPLLLHAAWQEHAGALLRELLLSTLADEADVEPIQMHAEATDALAILGEHVPEAQVDLDRHELMRGATEPHVSLERLSVPVPTASVTSFATLESAITAALELAGRGLTLTPPTQPELQLFRSWLCRQVLTQAEGSPAVPWSAEGDVPAEPSFELDWDRRAVDTAATGLIAADDANRILAVSPPAVELLGYDDPAELVGRRIVDIIPERYRQAHIAGFTLLHTTGRKPLLGRAVVVPALRRDGSEVVIRLFVEATRAGGGRSVFVAEIEQAPAS
jgi:PAS domain S-box-containing protein